MPTSACPPLIYSCPSGGIADKLELWTALGLSFRDQSDGRVALTEAERVAPPPPITHQLVLSWQSFLGKRSPFQLRLSWRWEDGSTSCGGVRTEGGTSRSDSTCQVKKHLLCAPQGAGCAPPSPRPQDRDTLSGGPRLLGVGSLAPKASGPNQNQEQGSAACQSMVWM